MQNAQKIGKKRQQIFDSTHDFDKFLPFCTFTLCLAIVAANVVIPFAEEATCNSSCEALTVSANFFSVGHNVGQFFVFFHDFLAIFAVF